MDSPFSSPPTPNPTPKPTAREISPRITTALIGIPLVLLVVWLGGLPFRLLCLALALGAMRELQSAAKRSDRLGGARIVGVVAYPAVFWAVWRGLTPNFAWQVLGALFFLGVLCYGVGPRISLASMGLTLLATLYVALFGLLPTLREAGQGELFLLTLLAVWASDTAAYFGGRAFGRRSLSPLSPGKTREGMLCGLFAATLVASLIAGWAQFSPLQGTALGVIIALAAPFGDLAESLWKRELGVKDLGTLFPGHGGILDRCDSLLFAVLGLMLYLAVVTS
ncbi:MAG TPA: phosphatidate cytidylyltransferase [Abditibacterium sp.]|jgi:phosphatidate cytidylyltransferase